jgi:hypothetical protein
MALQPKQLKDLTNGDALEIMAMAIKNVLKPELDQIAMKLERIAKALEAKKPG